jgi:hypothetical protein
MPAMTAKTLPAGEETLLPRWWQQRNQYKLKENQPQRPSHAAGVQKHALSFLSLGTDKEERKA